jgi:transcriptional regulator with XRE-family HTH domain
MEVELKRLLHLKCALTLKKFIDENKAQLLENRKSGIEDVALVYNLSQLSSAAGLRPATISSIFNGDSTPSITNIIQILLKLNRTLTQFGQYFDQIEDSEIGDFLSEVLDKKEFEKNKRVSK